MLQTVSIFSWRILILLSYRSSFFLTPSNLDLHFFLPVSGALDLSLHECWQPEFMSLVQAAFICFDAVLLPTCVSSSGSGVEEPSYWFCGLELVGPWVAFEPGKRKWGIIPSLQWLWRLVVPPSFYHVTDNASVGRGVLNTWGNILVDGFLPHPVFLFSSCCLITK